MDGSAMPGSADSTPLVDYAMVGGLREDYFITPSGEIHLCELGGNAVYAAAGARLWSARVGLIARVGHNYPVEWLSTIHAAGIDTTGVTVVPMALDTRTFYAYRSLEERDDADPASHFARLGQPLPAALAGYHTSTEGQEQREHLGPLAVRPDELPAAYRGARGCHLAPFDFLVHQHLPPVIRQQGTRYLTCDPSVRYMHPEFADGVGRIASQVDAFLPSAMEALAFFEQPPASLWEAAEAFAALGSACVVIKLGPQGQYVYDSAGQHRWHVPAYPARVRDVTGAGDAYCGGFLVGLAETDDPLEAAVRGTVSASFVVEGIGALYALEALAAAPAERETRAAAVRGAVRPL